MSFSSTPSDSDSGSGSAYRDFLVSKSIFKDNHPPASMFAKKTKPPPPYRRYRDRLILQQAVSDESLMMVIFEEWMCDFNRVYIGGEKLRRFKIFSERAKTIAEDEVGGIALGQFSDLTWEERKCFSGALMPGEVPNPNFNYDRIRLQSPVPPPQPPPNCVCLRSPPPPDP